MRRPVPFFDPIVAAYAAEHGWRAERDNESGGTLGRLPVFVLFVMKPPHEFAGSWFGTTSQSDAERMILPEMRAADAEPGAES